MIASAGHTASFTIAAASWALVTSDFAVFASPTPESVLALNPACLKISRRLTRCRIVLGLCLSAACLRFF